ncbi:MAG: FtsX-like permease family protein [Acidobacteria bacterium]|nr:FtsX-like permease family protein [Acidobacteriota bacterium]MYH30878.1 FtsX-like permease family protein [Acidobacteriota bacterium]
MKSRAMYSRGSGTDMDDDGWQARGLRFADECRQDLRHALRGLFRQPGFSVAATLTLGLGLGLTIGLFAVVDAVLLRPLPFADQDELVVMWERDDSIDNPHIEVSLPNFEDWRAQAESFADMAAMGSTTWGDVEVQEDPPVRLTISAVSASFFDTLGARAHLGRTFLPEEDGAEAQRVMVLSHAAWRQYFDMDPDVVGSILLVGARREPFTVVGIMPPAFRFPPGAEVWTPVGRELAGIFRQNGMDAGMQRGLGVLYVVGRLAPGRTVEQARAEMDVIVPGLWESHFSRWDTRRVVVTPLTDTVFGDAEAALLVLLGGGLLLLLIAGANVTGLMIVRSQSRRRDVAVQWALGIGRGRLFRAHLAETLLVTGAAAAGGIGLAAAALPVLVALGPADLPRLEQASVNGPAVGLGAGLAIAFGLAMTLAASPRPGRLSVVAWLRDAAHGATTGRAGAGARNLLVVSQVAMALVLTIGAGLLTSSYLNLARIDLGYRPAEVLALTLTPRDGVYEEDAPRRTAYRELLARVREVRGVEAAGGVLLLPFEHGVVGMDGGVLLEGEPLDGPDRPDRPPVAVQSVSPGYFTAMGIDLVAGRTFSDRDTTDAPAAVIVSESLARYLWRSGDAVGRRLIAIGAEADADGAPAWQTVAGVVEDARYRELERGRFDLYVPFTQVSMGLNHLVIRTAGDPVQLAAVLRSAVRQADPNFVIDSITPLRGLVDDVMRPWRFNMTMATLLAALAAGLAAIGLFGTVAYGVARRTREIGVRRALGARAVDVLRLVWGQAVALTLLGAAIGLGVALPAGELLRPLLFGVAPREAGTLGFLTALLVAVCASASLLAAWRATRIDPIAALRETE